MPFDGAQARATRPASVRIQYLVFSDAYLMSCRLESRAVARSDEGALFAPRRPESQIGYRSVEQ
ncbi:hypothetical protein [Bradyrhizobium sp. HKCCYLS20291]|uniref:hypothetical protein n=1 Tax=Bradyrhizobium sp. HKCCYLS20291 TaxID=3420766 RepID=UPI003EBFA119